jgi:hypothetical protein
MSSKETDFDDEQSPEYAVDEEVPPEAEEIAEPAPAVKKKSGALFFIVLCLLIFGAAFFAMRHLGGELPALIAIIKGEKPVQTSPSSVTPVAAEVKPAQVAANTAVDPLVQAVPAPVDGAGLPPSVMLDPLSSTQASENLSPADILAVPPMPSDVSEQTEKAIVAPVEQPALSAESPVAPVGDVAPVMAVNDAALSVPPQMPQDAPADPQGVAAQVETIQQDVLQPAAVLPDVPAVSPKLDDIESRLSRLESGLDEIKSMVSSQNTSSAELETLKGVVGALEEKVRDIKNISVQAAKTDDQRPAQPVVTHRSAKKPKPAAQASVQWQLKSAKPGKAWLSSAGSGEMTMVQTGDLLPGVGRVTAIDYHRESGKWYVQIGAIRITQ